MQPGRAVDSKPPGIGIDAAPVAPTAAVLTNSCYLIGMRL